MNSIETVFENIKARVQEGGLYSDIALFLLVIIVAVVSNGLTKKLIVTMVENIARSTKSKWDDVLVEYRVFRRLSHIVPALIVYAGVSFVFSGYPVVVTVIQRVSIAYMIIAGVLFIDALLNALTELYNSSKAKVDRIPVRSIVQMVKIVLYFLAAITILATVLGKSPMYFFGGLGALAAVLMLVFKDAILGFVAGIQLASNNMVRLGDWIEMPSHGADGDVIDISLTTVKVQNWNKTITTIPSYSMVSDSFINWRGMAEAQGRRIKRSVNIDVNSIKFCTEEMLEKFKKYECIKEKLPGKIDEVSRHNSEKRVDISEKVNGRRLTNVGVFRMYLEEYLKSHPSIEHSLTTMVRQLNPTEFGLPLEVYAFSSIKEWALYESIQADIFDHIFAVVKEFDLKIYQRPMA